jgi:uncharacterized protein YjiS (DUF1127 family)
VLQCTIDARADIHTNLPLKGITMFIAAIVAKIQSYLRYRETVRELSKLSDRELDDLGIVRSNITDIARHYAGA